MLFLCKKKIKNIIILLLSIFLMACNDHQTEKNNIDNDLQYLTMTSSKTLNTPKNVLLPLPDDEYRIPSIHKNRIIDKKINIFPPK
ncbi:MAG: hypothetical protein RA162_00150 [Arsenophonus sp.]|nr:MAG: hypothetical protein RA162_00150 [Arsenophonus sp.]